MANPLNSRRTEKITSFIVMDVLEKACEMECQGQDVIHLEVGEPDFDTPECVKDAACRAIHEGFTHYTHSLGLLELREAISDYYRETYNGIEVPAERILITSGTSPAMFLLFATLLDPEDEVIISDPHYACYPNFVKFVDGTPVFVPVTEAEGFQYRPEDIVPRLGPRTKGILINSPANPTGNVMDRNRLRAIADLAAAAPRPFIISDEIYHGLNYGSGDHSILEFTDRAFVLNGFSKLYAMTGLRLGYVIAPPEFVRPMQKLQQNFFISANAMVQRAGIAALTQAADDVERMRRTYDRRRQFMVQRLREMGLGITVEPTGAFYVFANVKHISRDSYALAFDILKEAKVGVTPGIDFGPQGEGYLRFSYAASMDKIREGLNRLEKYFRTR